MAADIAFEHGASVANSPDELIASVDAVAFAVPPDVQAELAVRAAQAGRHLVLEKPIAATVPDAVRLAGAVTVAGVASIVLLTRRYAPEVIEWLATAEKTGGWATGAATWYGGALLSGPFSHSPWRHERGGIADVGPHTLDLLDAALGPITDVLAARHGEPDLWHLVLGHENGVTSTCRCTARAADCRCPHRPRRPPPATRHCWTTCSPWSTVDNARTGATCTAACTCNG
jgi:predicted dehydrogenase